MENGLLTPERLDEAVTRVLALKAKLSEDYPKAVVDEKAEEKRCADEAVTLVKNTEGIIPVTADSRPNQMVRQTCDRDPAFRQ